MFKKAVKVDAKLRLALCGPAGSGKTYSLLSIASEIGGPIAYVDTEHGSASKYADLFQFDVVEPTSFDPRELIEFINGAAANGYKVICIDSLSHYWMGKGGELEMVDGVAKRSSSGNSFAAWKTVTPVHNQLVDTIISAPIHVLVSMRTKTEWVIETNDRGKQVPRKVGLAPVMRDGIEFEFDVCGDLDQDNNLTVTKSRCPALSGQVINRPGKQMAQTLVKWLAGAPTEPKPAPKPLPVAETRDEVVARRIAEEQAKLDAMKAQQQTVQPEVLPRIEEVLRADLQAGQQSEPKNGWFKTFMTQMALMKETLGAAEYYKALGFFGYEHANEVKSREKAKELFHAMAELRDAIKGKQN